MKRRTPAEWTVILLGVAVLGMLLYIDRQNLISDWLELQVGLWASMVFGMLPIYGAIAFVLVVRGTPQGLSKRASALMLISLFITVIIAMGLAEVDRDGAVSSWLGDFLPGDSPLAEWILKAFLAVVGVLVFGIVFGVDRALARTRARSSSRPA